MLQHRMHQHPFSSPPSSTGSRDTVSTTTEDLSRNLSEFSFSPDGEGTRRLGEDLQYPSKRHASRSGRFGSKHMPDSVLNTSVIARTFPEWSGLVTKDAATITQMVETPTRPRAAGGGKENVPPAPAYADESTVEDAADPKRKRSRADLQARVENESDCSTVLSLSPSRAPVPSRRSRLAAQRQDGTETVDAPKRSLQDMASKIRTENQNTKRNDTTPKRSPPRDVVHQNQHTPAANPPADHSMVSPTNRSFFLPAFRHLPDWTAGTLRFSTMKNGVPVFVRSGKSGVRLSHSGKDHGEIQSVGITPEDEEIFVSMDKLQEEVRELHDHDAMLQREAERLQREVNQLQAELKRFKGGRKLSDSAIGSDTDLSFRQSCGHNHELEEEVAQLRARLDQVSRQAGVNDIHSAALAAERDEALHQASVARERATKLQAELEAAQKELESSLQLLQEKEALQLEKATLLSENETLREQRDAAAQKNKTLTAENDKLRRELAGVQKDLAKTREELASVRKKHETLQEEVRNMAQNNANAERSNEAYIKENRKLQAQVAARDQHIADLKKGISSRDKMIDNIQGLTTDTAVLELNAELETEVERLQKKVEQQTMELHQKDGDISAKEGRIRSLKEQNLDLSIDNERLREENQRLRTEHEEIRTQWVDERHKVVRLNQLLTSKGNADYLKSLNDNTDECLRLEEEFKEKEGALRHKLERREAAVRKVKQLTSKIVEIAQREFTGKTTTKVTRIVEPQDMETITDEWTGKSSAVNVDDDPTQLHLTQESDFASVMENELAKLKQTYRDLLSQQQQQQQQQQDTDAGPAGDTVEVSDISLPPSAPALQRSKSDSSALPSKAARSKGQPVGILKKSTQFALEEDTGRYSVVNHDTEEVHNTVHSRRSSMGVTNPTEAESQRPDSRLRRDPTMTETNTRSAFFLPDVALQSNSKQDTTKQQQQQQQQQQTIPSLSEDARRVLDSICQHKSINCNVCVRIAAHGEKHPTAGTSSAAATNKVLVTPKDLERGKKTVSVEKPVPVSDRAPPAQQQQQQQQQEEPTLRPSMAPGEALAILIKETRDEIDHLQMELRRLNDVYFGLDKSVGQRERRRVMASIRKVQADLEARSAHLYRLHDVLEGQKAAGQLMEGDAIDVTVLSGLLRAEAEPTAEGEVAEWA